MIYICDKYKIEIYTCKEIIYVFFQYIVHSAIKKILSKLCHIIKYKIHIGHKILSYAIDSNSSKYNSVCRNDYYNETVNRIVRKVLINKSM